MPSERKIVPRALLERLRDCARFVAEVVAGEEVPDALREADATPDEREPDAWVALSDRTPPPDLRVLTRCKCYSEGEDLPESIDLLGYWIAQWDAHEKSWYGRVGENCPEADHWMLIPGVGPTSGTVEEADDE